MEPVTLRHKDAFRQSALYASFALVVLAIIVGAFVLSIPGAPWILVLTPVFAFLAYSAVRLATLRVRIDDEGVWEPNPFRLTYVTPWNDLRKARKARSAGAMRISFVGVEIVHADGGAHEVVALKMQAGAAYAEPSVEAWIDAINDAKALRNR